MHRVSRRLPAEPKVKEDADDAPYEGEDTHEDAEATRTEIQKANQEEHEAGAERVLEEAAISGNVAMREERGHCQDAASED